METHAYLATPDVDGCSVSGCGQPPDGPAHVHLPDENEPITALGFAAYARAIGGAARHMGMRTPAFRGNGAGYPEGGTRYIRRYPGGATVGVKLTGRRAADVRLDMLVGCCVANDLALDNPKAHQLAGQLGVI